MSDTYDKVAKNIKPGWLKIKLHNDVKYADVSKIVEKHGLHTICDSGKCPNKAECWSRKTATFMILGDVCTRSCKFCATKPVNRYLPNRANPKRSPNPYASWGSNMPYSHPWTGTTYPTEEPAIGPKRFVPSGA